MKSLQEPAHEAEAAVSEVIAAEEVVADDVAVEGDEA